MKKIKLTAEQKKVKKELARMGAKMLKQLNIKLTRADEDHGIDGCATCRKRASYAAAAIAVYLKNGTDDFETLFGDFFSDLRHLADYLKIDFDEALEKGDRAYAQEVAGEKEWRARLKAIKDAPKGQDYIEIDGRWECKNCGNQLSAMIADTDVPKRCECAKA